MEPGIGSLFDSFPIALNLLIFVGLAGLIWISGARLSYFIDAVAEQTKIARAFMGLILLATATELPEMVTTLTASSTGNGALALNNMFGGMMLQVAVLAIADIFVVRGTLTSYPRSPTLAIAGLLSILSLSLILVVHLTSDIRLVAHIGIGSLFIGMLYILSMYLLKVSADRDIWSPVDLPNEKEAGEDGRQNRYDDSSLNNLVIFSIIAAVVILICGVLVVRVAETLADQTGLGSSFIGVSLLAMTTSLPELSTSVAAVKVKAYTMAISNIFGSNLIMTFLLVPVDLFFLEGPILNQIDSSASFALAAGILLTAIYCIGLLTRPRIKVLRMGVDSLLALLFYIASMTILYYLR